ncbi:substrate-binding domain-containing protein [Vibrio vulnificus]|nr:tungsten ABC transporter substrate-binding protein [Vibrio vulnificus]EHU4795887.1 substrate-binding domain-containing protein [Vibrio vulnificus]EHU4933222.1 substrate-binding domain-containing protein [Vibrio vulnificus]EHZ2650547.1 substrate-binding domain-containing protein [Vibrio vulnificus]EIA1307374.1 substrate-binding domain-containing protein [Vibrio vulnificus]
MNKVALTLAATSITLVSFSSFSADDVHRVRLATTTSTYHSGLLDYLLPEFEKDTGYKVDVLAAGTGKSLKMGENGDVDLVMTHAPKAEATFVEKGYGVLPRKLMYNDFIVVGPKADPAKVAQDSSVLEVFKAIANNNATFISRGDDSGTHKKELGIWAQTKMEPNFGGYRSVGQGMGPTLNMASEMQGYTLTDRGTWLAYNNKLDLAVLFEGDQKLFNPYQVILVNPKRYPSINYQGAKVFSDWLVNPRGQELINSFRLNGKQLFVANADQK